MDLPEKGDWKLTDDEPVRQADQRLLRTLELLDDVYGWVQVLEVLRDKVAAKYPSGTRFADYLIKAEEYKARWAEAEDYLDKGN